eukprot:CAMPEP_0170633450 /NCGR_PEP_ID=MMETSP0224-20130122/35999_1 /TAXON_ID=285029 /ORGANISM="Togula jolla, Strain CCCM 725" /LENGTH=452 /DNA_ID=CAMNT_0010962493 /DNA_START=178 /DNA_END=1536 /DNA_ORIENTATION=-
MKSALSGVIDDECQSNDVDHNSVSLLQELKRKSFSTEKVKQASSTDECGQAGCGKRRASATALHSLGEALALGVAEHPPIISMVGVGVLLCLIIALAYSQLSSGFPFGSGRGLLGMKLDDGFDREEVVSVPPSPVQEDTYGFAVVSMVRDTQMIAKGEGAFALRSSRMLAALGLLYMTIFCQIGLVLQVKWYVTPTQVSSIRNDYSGYEHHMYDGHTTLTVNGKHRGIPEFFEPENFNTFDESQKMAVCSIPFSQLSFLMLVLFIWSLTCAAQIKSALEFLFCIVYTVSTVQSMSDSLGDDDQDSADPEQEHVIRSLTLPMKLWMALTILLPWLFVTIYLCFLGCRWLAATNDFGALVSNAVALEFILLLKDLFYNALVPARSKRDVQKTMLLPAVKQEQAGWLVFFGSFIWGVATISWVFCYVFRVQSVLPEYRWDVHNVCAKYLEEISAR